jgi:hypothetical protein
VLRIRDVYPESRILILCILDPGSWIPDSTTATKRRGKNFVGLFFCSHKNDKIKNQFIFEQVPKKNLSQFKKNYSTFCRENCHQVIKNMGLGSGILDPGAKKATDPGSATLVSAVFWAKR